MTLCRHGDRPGLLLENLPSKTGYRSGMITLFGNSNVGKSTLLNRLIGTKLAIVSKKPQTTRTRITGVLSIPEGQLVFLDTPGIHRPRFELNRRMLQTATESLRHVDLIAWVIDVVHEGGVPDKRLLSILDDTQTPVCLLINKVDRVPWLSILPVIDRYRTVRDFKEIVPISALKGTNVDRLPSILLPLLPEGGPLYPPDRLTDADEAFLVSEMVREKVFRVVRQEIPYCTAVNVRNIELDEDENLLVVTADLWVEKSSQKAILIGKGGSMIKQIGMTARKETEALLGHKIYLDLRVKVKDRWRQRSRDLDELGLRV